MSIPPKFASLVKVAAPSPETLLINLPINTVDLYIDFVCPFARKLFLKFEGEFIPLIAEKFPGQFRFVLRPVVQPWHALALASTSEAFLAVNQVAPKEAWNFAKVLYEHQRNFFDTAIVDLSRNEVYKKLAAFAVEELELTKKYGITEDDIYKRLHIRHKRDDEEVHQNIDSGVTLDLKYFIRQHRAMSVNATPTIAINGVIVPQIESSTLIEDLVKIFKGYAT